MYEKLENFIESNQEKAKNKLIIAKIHLEFGEYDLAIQEYEQILGLYPDDINVKKALIELYKRVTNYDALIKLALELNNAFADNEIGLWALETLMDTYKTIKNYEKALEYANLIKIHPLSNNVQSGENIALILLDEGKTNESIELFKSLLIEDPNNILLKKELAAAYEKNKDFNQATDIYKKILEDHYSKPVSEMFFVQLHPNFTDYKVFEVPNLQDTVDKMFDDLIS